MDTWISQLETAISKLNTNVSSSERLQYEEVILRFRNCPRPYDICKEILNTSRNPQMLYEVSKCLSNAVIREWSSVFCPNDLQLTADNVASSPPYQLMSYLLQWVATCRKDVAVCARQGVLGVVGTIAKRAAAAQAQVSLATMRPQPTDSTDSSLNCNPDLGVSCNAPTLLTPPFENPGAASPLVTLFLSEVSNLLAPLPAGASFQVESGRLSLGLAILSAFLEEMANVDQDSTKLNVPLEAHVYMQARFQSVELLEIFQVLLRLVQNLLTAHDWPTTQADSDETTFRLVHCLELITSYGFLPDHIIDFNCLQARSRKVIDFRPCTSWACVVGADAIIDTLALLLKLHTRLRHIPDYCSRILTAIVAVTAPNGNLVAGPSASGGHSPTPLSPLVEHASVCMSMLALALMPTASPLPPPTTTPLLLQHTLSSTSDKPLVVPSEMAQLDLGAFPHAARIQAAFAGFFRQSAHLPHELPLLADICVNLLGRLNDVCNAMDSFTVNSKNWPSWSDPSAGEKADAAVLAKLVFCLSGANEFLKLVKAILFECLLLEAGVTPAGEDAVDAMGAAHEACERIFSYLSDFISAFPQFDGSNGNAVPPLAYTTGPHASCDRMMYTMGKLYGQMREKFQGYQEELVRFYLAAHLAAPVGFRRDVAVDNGEELDLSIDEEDTAAYEDSLFAIGQFSHCTMSATSWSLPINGSAACTNGGVVSALGQLLSLRGRQLLVFDQPDATEVPFVLLEDLHWLLLLVGHVLVSGPSQISTSSPGSSQFSTWDCNFSIPSAIWSMGPSSFSEEEYTRNRQYLIASMQSASVSALEENIQPVIRLLAVLFRVLEIQVVGGRGSAQLMEDSLWVFTRITLTYFSTPYLSGPDSNLDYVNNGATEANALDGGDGETLVRALLRPNHTTGGGAQQELQAFASATLTRWARAAMATWAGEPNVAHNASNLLAAIARHSLFNLDRNESVMAASREAWTELCALVCKSEGWLSLNPDTLAELVDSCARGCWCLRSHQSDLFYEFVNELRTRLNRPLILAIDFGVCGPDGGDELRSSDLVSGLAVVRGLARALHWIVSHGGGGSTASSSTGLGNPMPSTDLVGFLWTGLFLPVLRNCALLFVQRYHMEHEVMLAVLTVFGEVAEHCLLHLANAPASVHGDQSTEAELTAAARSLPFAPPDGQNHTGASLFFLLTALLCSNYTRFNLKKVTNASRVAEKEAECVAELRKLVSLLHYFLTHEFELRLYGEHAAYGSSPSVDVALPCAGLLLPLLTPSALSVPTLAEDFYHFLAYALELRPDRLLVSGAALLGELGRLLRHGVFELAEVSVNISALEAITYLAEFCAAPTGESTMTTATAAEVATQLHLDKSLLGDLLGLVTRHSFPTQLTDTLAGCIYALCMLDLRAFEEVATECVSRCSGDAGAQQRLQKAFLDLLGPLLPPSTAAAGGGASRLLTSTSSDRKRRTDFQARFHAFVPTVRAFLCSY